MKKASRTEGDEEEEDEGGEEAAMNAMMSSIPIPRAGLAKQTSRATTTAKNSTRPKVMEMSPEEEEEELENR